METNNENNRKENTIILLPKSQYHQNRYELRDIFINVMT